VARLLEITGADQLLDVQERAGPHDPAAPAHGLDGCHYQQ